MRPKRTWRGCGGFSLPERVRNKDKEILPCLLIYPTSTRRAPTEGTASFCGPEAPTVPTKRNTTVEQVLAFF